LNTDQKKSAAMPNNYLHVKNIDIIS